MSEGLPWPPTKEDLERLYIVEKLSAAKIAKVYGLKYKSPKVAESTVLYQLKRNGIARRGSTDHIRKVTEAEASNWVERYQKGESLKQIAGKEWNPVTVFHHLHAKGIELRDKVEAQIKATTKHARALFDGSENERAYLLGFTKGDCQVVRHGRAVRVRTSTTHPAMADLFTELFGAYGYVHRYPRRAKFAGFEWNLEIDLDSSFGFLFESVENAIKFSARRVATFLSFLAGFFDAEGSIYFHQKFRMGAFEVLLTNTDLSILSRLQKFLAVLGIFSKLETRNQSVSRLGGNNEGKISKLMIWRSEDVVQLLRALQLRHLEKTTKAEIALSFQTNFDRPVRESLLRRWEEILSYIHRERDRFVMEAELAFRSRRERSGQGKKA
jgi:LAGLIDADG-like domain